MMRWKIFKIHVLEDPFSFLGKEEEPLAGRSDINYSPKYKYTHMTPGGDGQSNPTPPLWVSIIIKYLSYVKTK